MRKLFQKSKIISFLNPLGAFPLGEGTVFSYAWRHVNSLAKHPIISGTTIIIIGSFIGNFFNFLFSLFMTRNLSFSDFSILASLSSLMILFSLPVGAVVPMLVYFSASYFAKNELHLVRGLYFQVTKPALLIGAATVFLFFIFKNEISNFFHIQDSILVSLVGVSTFFAFVGVANQPLLQAKLSFPFISFTTSLASFLKLFLGVVFVLFGFSVGGALLGLIIASTVPYFLSFIPLNFLLKKGRETFVRISFKKLTLYGAPAALSTLSLTSFINVDIILVKHFFIPEQAGIYAVLSLIGRVIYYLSAPVSMVMFPHLVQKYAKGENYHKDFILALLLVFLPSLALIIFYSLFPTFVFRIFSQNPISNEMIRLIIPFGIFLALYSVLSIITNFYLSINKTKVFIPLVCGSLLQVVGIWIFHKDFLHVILVSLSVVGLLLFILLLYYWRLYGKNSGK